jgi:hypothetical protein
VMLASQKIINHSEGSIVRPQLELCSQLHPLLSPSFWSQKMVRWNNSSWSYLNNTQILSQRSDSTGVIY